MRVSEVRRGDVWVSRGRVLGVVRQAPRLYLPPHHDAGDPKPSEWTYLFETANLGHLNQEEAEDGVPLYVTEGICSWGPLPGDHQVSGLVRPSTLLGALMVGTLTTSGTKEQDRRQLHGLVERGWAAVHESDEGTGWAITVLGRAELIRDMVSAP